MVLAEPEPEAKPSKVVQKRSGLVGHYGLGAPLIGHGVGIAHGYGLGYGLGGIGYGSGALVAGGYAAGLASGPILGANIHTSVTKHVGVPVPAPYPVAVDRPVPVPVKVGTMHFSILYILI